MIAEDRLLASLLVQRFDLLRRVEFLCDAGRSFQWYQLLDSPNALQIWVAPRRLDCCACRRGRGRRLSLAGKRPCLHREHDGQRRNRGRHRHELPKSLTHLTPPEGTGTHSRHSRSLKRVSRLPRQITDYDYGPVVGRVKECTEGCCWARERSKERMSNRAACYCV